MEASEKHQHDVGKMHYIIYSPTRGIFLSNDLWSGEDNGRGLEHAPAWSKSLALYVLKRVVKKAPDAMLKEVYPDRNIMGTMFASEEACASAGLPRWNPLAFKGKE